MTRAKGFGMSLPHEGPGVHARTPDLGLTAEEFLRLLWPPSDDYEAYGGHVNIWTLQNRQSSWFKATELDKVAAMAARLAATKDVYAATALIDLAARKQQEAIDNRGVVDVKRIRGTNA